MRYPIGFPRIHPLSRNILNAAVFELFSDDW